MFGRNSRYHGSDTVAVPDESGRSVQVVKLRPLPAVSGEATTVRSGDQLDVMSDRRYKEGTRFWHLADANSELEANALVARDGRVIRVPRR